MPRPNGTDELRAFAQAIGITLAVASVSAITAPANRREYSHDH